RIPTNLTLRPKRSNSQTVKKSHIRSRSWASDNLRYLNLPWPLARGPLGLPHLATFAATYGPKPPSHTQPCSRWAHDADPFKIANRPARSLPQRRSALHTDTIAPSAWHQGKRSRMDRTGNYAVNVLTAWRNA